jgi:hypothetical protein
LKGPAADGQEATAGNEEGGAHSGHINGVIHPPLQRSESSTYKSCLFTLPNSSTFFQRPLSTLAVVTPATPFLHPPPSGFSEEITKLMP